MESHILPIFFYLNLMMFATHAALPPELYWKRMLPSTPMPKAITEILSRGGGNTHIVQWGQSVDSEVTAWLPTAVETASLWEHAAEETAFAWLFAAEETAFAWQHAAEETISQDQLDNHANAPLLVMGPAAINRQLHDHPNADLFFSEEELRPGTKKNLHFSKSKYAAPLLPRQIAELIPFSTDKAKEVLNKFSVKPKSKSAEIIEIAIRNCEEPAFEGEEKYCATSLESLVDFITSKLGKNVHAISTEVDNEMKLQKFSVKHGVKKLAQDKVIACHRMSYPYAVFLCHKLIMTSAYFVPLEGEDGARVNSIALCHGDTSKWNPKHLAFKVLKVKPGTAPVCHFSPADNVVWFPK